MHGDESYIILGKHNVSTIWQRNNRSLWHLKFSQKPSKPICPLETSKCIDFKTPNCLQIGSRSPVTPKLPPSGFQNEPQSDTKSIKYPSLIQSKTDSDFGLLMTLSFQQISLDLEVQMPSTCIKFNLTTKHSSNNKHQKCIGFYKWKQASSVYMST